MWIIRILIGGIFIISGAAKLLSPYQNFLYVIQAYQMLPPGMETLAARVFPWIELFVGAFVFLGLWTPWALKAEAVMFGFLVLVVGQALLRNLPLENCGCFGEWIHLKPQAVMALDSLSLLLVVFLLRHLSGVRKFSLDAYFEHL